MINDCYSTTMKFEVIRQISTSHSKSVMEVKEVGSCEIDENSGTRMILSKINNSCKDEIYFSTNLRHTYIPSVITTWRDHEHAYIVTEKVPGRTLWEIIDAREEITEIRKIMICLKLAEVLRYLHRGMDLPVIHGDISPGNILITNEYIPYLIDFGSSFKSRRVSVKKVYSGTYGYFSPKLVGDPYLIDETVDIYSFGMIMKTLGIIDSSVEMYQLYTRCVRSSDGGIQNGEELVEEFERLIL